jgi:hydrogenase nickel incorporation protein HypA/HybF
MKPRRYSTCATWGNDMHEMGIAMQIVDITKASMPLDQPHAKVARINLKIGRLAAIVPDSLRFCFDIIVKDTALAEAELIIEEIPIRARCKDCHAEWTISSPVFTCIQCRSSSIVLLSGRELDIHSIEILDEDV